MHYQVDSGGYRNLLFDGFQGRDLVHQAVIGVGYQLAFLIMFVLLFTDFMCTIIIGQAYRYRLYYQ